MATTTPMELVKVQEQVHGLKRKRNEMSMDLNAMKKDERLEYVTKVARDQIIDALANELSYSVSENEWENLVQLTKSHPNFHSLFAYPDPKTTLGWVKAKPLKNGKKKKYLKIIAIDCEMCVTAPIGKEKERISSALCRVSAVDGEDMIRNIVADIIVHQPEQGYRMIDPKTDIHGITMDQLRKSKVTIEKAQKYLLKYISSETIVVGHSVHGDLASLRINHTRVIDTALIFQRVDSTRGLTPGLKCLTKFLLNFEMPNGHDSAIDAQASMLAAKYAVKYPTGNIIPNPEDLHGTQVREHKMRDWEKRKLQKYITTSDGRKIRILHKKQTISTNVSVSPVPGVPLVPRFPQIDLEVKEARSCRLHVHRIPKGITHLDVENFFKHNAKIVAVVVEKVTWKKGSKFGRSNVMFHSRAHAQLAFDSAAPSKKNTSLSKVDAGGNPQKAIRIVNSKGKVFEDIRLTIAKA